jgi:hypothetical protein
VLREVPGLRPRHIRVQARAPGSILVALSGLATDADCTRVATSIERELPAGILVDVALDNPEAT